LRHGNEEQKKKYLTGIAKGEIAFCLGYSEPEAGSDLGSLSTRATRDGDEYVINGQKIFTSMAHNADYIWLAARTDPNAPKHRGISMFICPRRIPNISIVPLINILGSHHFNEVFFDNARIPKECLVGKENEGWRYLMTSLNYERSGVYVPAFCRRFIEMAIKFIKETANGQLAGDPIIRHKLAEMAVMEEVTRLLCYRVTWLQNKGQVPISESSMSFLMASNIIRFCAMTSMDILGMYGQLDRDSKWTVAGGQLEALYLCCLPIGIGAGTFEIQRNIIARLGLGLPRA
jgi:hypothetical protein